MTVSCRRVTIWDGKYGHAKATFHANDLFGLPESDITSCCLDQQGHKLVVGSDTGMIRLCFSHNGSLIRNLDPHTGLVNWLSFSSHKTDK
ncbi:unnamed protein product [Choristocarpus tenellus]